MVNDQMVNENPPLSRRVGDFLFLLSGARGVGGLPLAWRPFAITLLRAHSMSIIRHVMPVVSFDGILTAISCLAFPPLSAWFPTCPLGNISRDSILVPFLPSSLSARTSICAHFFSPFPASRDSAKEKIVFFVSFLIFFDKSLPKNLHISKILRTFAPTNKYIL